jgi:hypothetical protein
VDPRVAARKARPAAVSATPIHSRLVTGRWKIRSAMTVSRTSPPAITDCTSEIGARLSAATCRPHDPIATPIPSAYQGDRSSASDELTGRDHSTAGASTAPRYL